VISNNLSIATSIPEMGKSIVTDQGRVDMYTSIDYLRIYMLVIGVSILSDRVRQLTIQTRFSIDEDTWPPNQPQHFTPILLAYHTGQYSFKETAALQSIAGFIKSDNLCSHYCLQQSPKDVFSYSKATKELVDILGPLEGDNAQFVLVEGLPGIGKSLLLQEIAYNWAIGKLLQKFKLVLLVQLHNPAVQQMSYVADLLHSFCEGDKDAPKISAMCNKYLFRNGGRDAAFLFDGLDEFPEQLRKKEFY